MSKNKNHPIREIPVTSRQTGETKLVEAPVNNLTRNQEIAAAVAPVLNTSSEKLTAATAADLTVESVDNQAKPGNKEKKEIETIDEYLEAFFSGKVKSLSDKMVKRLGQNPVLEMSRRAELLDMAFKADFSLDKTRHLLLLSIDIGSNKRLERTLRDFARLVLIRHPVMGPQDAQAWFPQSDGAPALPIKAMWDLFGSNFISKKSEPRAPKEGGGTKPVDIPKACRNAFFAAVIWRYAEQQMPFLSIVSGLRETVYRPKSNFEHVETATLDLLATTQDKDREGLACFIRWFSDLINQTQNQVDHHQRRADRLEGELKGTQGLLEAKESEIAAMSEEIKALHAQVKVVQEELRVQKVHSRDDLERQRSRTLRTLEDEIPVLADCLTALRRDPPKVEVTKEYLESALDKLNEELKQLKGN